MLITGMPPPAMDQLIYTLYLSVAYNNQPVFSPCQVFKCAVLSLRKKTKNPSKNYSDNWTGSNRGSTRTSPH